MILSVKDIDSVVNVNLLGSSQMEKKSFHLLNQERFDILSGQISIRSEEELFCSFSR
jgi:hypothetical protein